VILRRITDALKRQDWFTVAIETLIVLLGVFLGLQANNWNADRIARDQANDLLQRMIVEAQEARADMADYRDFQDSILDAGIKLVVRLQAKEDCLAMDDEMKSLLVFVGDFPPPRFSLATASEAIESGDLSAIGSDDIRDEARRIIDEKTFMDRQWQRYVLLKQDSEKAIFVAAGLSLERDEALRTQLRDKVAGIDQFRVLTPEGVCGNPEMIAYATSSASTQQVYTEYIGQVSEKLDAYAALLSDYGSKRHLPDKEPAP
jgi:hypothetical protein